MRLPTRRTTLLLLIFLSSLHGLVGCKRGSNKKAPELDPIMLQAQQIFRDQAQNDQRIWTHEVRATEYEATINSVVDAVRLSTNRLATLKTLSFGDLSFRNPGSPVPALWGTLETPFDGELTTWVSNDWQSWIDALISETATIDYFSLRLTAFNPGSADTNGLDKAEVSFECHAKIPQEGKEDLALHVLKGVLSITWDLPVPGNGVTGPIASIVAHDFTDQHQLGRPAFAQKRRYAVGDPSKRQAVRITPVIVRDLDGDLQPDIILGGVNLLLRNQGNFVFENSPLLSKDLRFGRVSALADFTGDAHVDLLAFLSDGSPILIPGVEGGTFSETPIQPWSNKAEYPSGIAVGDVDGDGDLDAWVSQYRPTYHRGALPKSISNANDGFPSRLFRNDGDGTFTEITGEANLGAHRLRRTTSASFLDFDRDGDPDLLMTSDYAGVELFDNDGKGVFTNITESTFGEWHLLGMSAAIGRFDSDDKLDIFAGGRWSVPMQRMNGLLLGRDDFPDFRPLAAQMSSGNQLFLSRRDYETGPFSAAAKNTGWTNSATAADFDNDDDDDLYLTNGHVTGRSVSDFDSQFWRHDVYLTEGVQDEVLQAYVQTPVFAPRLAALRKGEISWYGYEANRLDVNGDNGFSEMGYLHGVGLNQDSPAALSADLNNDGRMDLLTVAQRTFLSNGRLAVEQSLVIYENTLETEGHWFGVHLAPNAPEFLDVGATIRIEGEFGVRERFLTTGLTPTVQGPASAHFGLGAHTKIDALSVRWGNGHEQVLIEPAVDQYHTISPRLDFTPVPDPPAPEPEEEESESEE